MKKLALLGALLMTINTVFAADPKVAEALGITTEKYEASVKKSLLNKGNNYLVKQVIEKLQAGQEDVVIAALGGSVTEGAGPAKYTDGYAYQTAALIKAKYAANPDKVHFIGAGIGGTPSPMGLLRYEKDVFKTPDLLIIEFAVNDWQECSNTRAFEYMCRNFTEQGTAVVVVYAAATYGNQQAVMSPVAQFYKIPEVSVSNALAYSGINSEKDTKIYYSDFVHPTKNGHTFMADCIMNLLDTLAAAPKDAPFQTPSEYRNRNPFTNWHTVYGTTADSNVTLVPGPFTKKDTVVQNYMKGGKSFPDNWHTDGKTPPSSSVEPVETTVETTAETTSSMKISLICKNFILITKESNMTNFGQADIYIDGQKKKTLQAYNKAGWNNCVVTMIIDEPEAKEHIIEIRPEPGKAFTVLAFGYVN